MDKPSFGKKDTYPTLLGGFAWIRKSWCLLHGDRMVVSSVAAAPLSESQFGVVV